MPGQDFSDKIGKSSSPMVNQIIDNNKNVQEPYATPAAAIDQAHNKQTVTPGK